MLWGWVASYGDLGTAECTEEPNTRLLKKNMGLDFEQTLFLCGNNFYVPKYSWVQFCTQLIVLTNASLRAQLVTGNSF